MILPVHVRTLAGLGFAGLLLGCQAHPLGMSPDRQAGRFTGIGVFDAGRLWRQMTGARDGAPSQARVADDEHVIVVLDSRSGEVRECGDHSGYCVRLNPWSGSVPTLPAALAKHADDLRRDDANEAEAENTARPLK